MRSLIAFLNYESQTYYNVGGSFCIRRKRCEKEKGFAVATHKPVPPTRLNAKTDGISRQDEVRPETGETEPCERDQKLLRKDYLMDKYTNQLVEFGHGHDKSIGRITDADEIGFVINKLGVEPGTFFVPHAAAWILKFIHLDRLVIGENLWDRRSKEEYLETKMTGNGTVRTTRFMCEDRWYQKNEYFGDDGVNTTAWFREY